MLSLLDGQENAPQRLSDLVLGVPGTCFSSSYLSNGVEAIHMMVEDKLVWIITRAIEEVMQSPKIAHVLIMLLNIWQNEMPLDQLLAIL